MKRILILIVIAWFSLVGVGAAGLAGGVYVGRTFYPRYIEVDRSEWNILTEVNRVIEREWQGNIPSKEDRANATIRGYLKSLDDKHTVYESKKELEVGRHDLSGGFAGIGATVTQGTEFPTLSPLKGTPAEKAGIKYGDQIIEVDGQSIRGWNIDEVVRIIRGRAGTPVTLTLFRAGVGEIEITVVRGNIRKVHISSRMVSDGVVYVKLELFAKGVEIEFRKALESAIERGATGLILDLRDNPGGYMEVASDIADELIGEGIIYRQRTKYLESSHRAGKRGLGEELEIVVIVDGGSASASEVLAGALRDNGRATIIGQPTFGKGVGGISVGLSNGGQLHVTTFRWYTPSGQSLSEEPIRPHVLVPTDVKGTDIAFNKALQILLEEVR